MIYAALGRLNVEADDMTGRALESRAVEGTSGISCVQDDLLGALGIAIPGEEIENTAVSLLIRKEARGIVSGIFLSLG